MASPAHVGAWSMAVLLGQPFEYYYCTLHHGKISTLECKHKTQQSIAVTKKEMIVTNQSMIINEFFNI